MTAIRTAVLQRTGFDVERIRADFPILRLRVNGRPLVFLDNAASSQMPQPVIAKINDWVFGGGFTVVTGCDIAIAADDVRLGLSEVNFGHFPGGEVTIVLTEHLQPKHGLYYALTGKTMSAQEAERIGLITKAVPRADLDKEVMEIANNLKEKAPSALHAVKEAWYYSFFFKQKTAYEISGLISDKAKLAIGGRPGAGRRARAADWGKAADLGALSPGIATSWPALK